MDEGKSGTVINAGLGGQRETDLIFLTRLWRTDLDVRGQHRIRRGKHGTEQKGHGPRQGKPCPTQKCDERDPQGEGQEDEPPGDHP